MKTIVPIVIVLFSLILISCSENTKEKRLQNEEAKPSETELTGKKNSENFIPDKGNSTENSVLYQEGSERKSTDAFTENAAPLSIRPEVVGRNRESQVKIVLSAESGKVSKSTEDTFEQYKSKLDKPASFAFEPILPEVQCFTFSPSSEISIQCESGTQLVIPSNAFVNASGEPTQEEVTFSLREFYKITDILLAGLATQSADGFLETGGMLHLSAKSNGEELSLAAGKRITLRMPVDNTKPSNKAGMMLYTSSNSADKPPVIWQTEDVKAEIEQSDITEKKEAKSVITETDTTLFLTQLRERTFLSGIKVKSLNLPYNLHEKVPVKLTESLYYERTIPKYQRAERIQEGDEVQMGIVKSEEVLLTDTGHDIQTSLHDTGFEILYRADFDLVRNDNKKGFAGEKQKSYKLKSIKAVGIRSNAKLKRKKAYGSRVMHFGKQYFKILNSEDNARLLNRDFGDLRAELLLYHPAVDSVIRSWSQSRFFEPKGKKVFVSALFKYTDVLNRGHSYRFTDRTTYTFAANQAPDTIPLPDYSEESERIYELARARSFYTMQTQLLGWINTDTPYMPIDYLSKKTKLISKGTGRVIFKANSFVMALKEGKNVVPVPKDSEALAFSFFNEKGNCLFGYKLLSKNSSRDANFKYTAYKPEDVRKITEQILEKHGFVGD